MSYKVLTSEAELNEALSNDSFLLFKHSLTCPISAEAKEEFEKFLDDSSLPAYMIHIQDNRDLSNQVADQFEIKHESPQFFYVKDGAVNYHNSHWHIKYDTLKEVVK
ncbi:MULTISPECIES: bacillithiol system redox-active protein YtxJ [Allobacillus]|uniref:Bacillithiol system redox-active protein YtxJ n=1 Tax=Allobacillus halotolerans TaxID=570278 RepID=A0ABS6GP52_9BACI|nr:MULTISPECIES: bacillithiol system redox-active protein YtxJ [Allobacillus]MBU6080258.1 bacillithiol system redox-active protein YtxJ [Allobacillus halotolerans]TSJ68461.1 bacillithiol system redox-active protein YtxJ [Allobacillus sp. SKP2-8]